jgi:hypothetical protein
LAWRIAVKIIKSDFHPDYDTIVLMDMNESSCLECIFKKNGKAVAVSVVHPMRILELLGKQVTGRPSLDLALAKIYNTALKEEKINE